MTQQQAQKKTQDPYAQRGKALTSLVQRLRGWVGSDPSRVPELADALVELTAHRLLGHVYAPAAADAQEAVSLAARLLTANGPIGPYTSVTDAARCITSVVHLAALQTGVSALEAAGRTVASVTDLREQLQQLRPEEHLLPQTIVWALVGSARTTLAAGDVSGANAYADAALDRLTESGLRADADHAYLTLDVDRTASDCRWAADRAPEALTLVHAARAGHDELVAGRLDEPGRLSPALMERLAEPLPGLYRDVADRLLATGERDLGLATRRRLVELLQRLGRRLGDPGRIQLATAMADLAADLLAADRVVEAEQAAAEAATALPEGAASVGPRLLVAAVAARATTRAGRPGDAVGMLRPLLAVSEPTSAVAGTALAALAEALRASGDVDAAVATEASVTSLSRALLGVETDPEESEESVGRLLDLARGVVSRGRQPVSWQSLPAEQAYAGVISTPARTGPHAEDLAAQQRETAAWLEAERAEAHRRELERMEQTRLEAERLAAERATAERTEAQRLAAVHDEAERAARLEAERLSAVEEEERVARKRRREERLEEHRLELERLEEARREAERVEAEQQEARRLAKHPAEAERVKLARLQAELVELERQQAEQERERAELERQHAEAPEEPPEEPEEPVVRAEEPEEPVVRAEEPEEPVVRAEKPEEPVVRAEEPEEPVVRAEELVEVTEEAEVRAEEPTEVTEESVVPVEEPIREPEEPVVRLEEPVEEPVARPEEPEEPVVRPEEPIEVTEKRREPVPEPSAVPPDEPPQPDELVLAQQAWLDARSRGDRRAARAAGERLVELLRPRAEADLATYGPQLRQALEDLASARLRGGDLFGSRSAAREARALSRSLDR